MPPINVLYKPIVTSVQDSTGVALFFFDAIIKEEPLFQVDITRFPVEKGISVTDHLRPLPIRLTLDGICSNTPLAGGVTLARNAPGPADIVGAALIDLHDNPILVTIITPRRIYNNMALKELTWTREAATGEAFKFIAIFEEVRLVTNQTTVVKGPPPKKNNGSVTPKPAHPKWPDRFLQYTWSRYYSDKLGKTINLTDDECYNVRDYKNEFGIDRYPSYPPAPFTPPTGP